MVYSGDVVEIALTVGASAKRFDAPGFINALEKSGVKRVVLNKLAKEHTHDNRAPHKFAATLATA